MDIGKRHSYMRDHFCPFWRAGFPPYQHPLSCLDKSAFLWRGWVFSNLSAEF